MRDYQTSALLLLAAGSFTAHAYAPASPRSPVATAKITDLTKVGSLTVPLIGCGTIAWTSDKGEKKTPSTFAFIICIMLIPCTSLTHEYDIFHQ